MWSLEGAHDVHPHLHRHTHKAEIRNDTTSSKNTLLISDNPYTNGIFQHFFFRGQGTQLPHCSWVHLPLMLWPGLHQRSPWRRSFGAVDTVTTAGSWAPDMCSPSPLHGSFNVLLLTCRLLHNVTYPNTDFTVQSSMNLKGHTRLQRRSPMPQVNISNSHWVLCASTLLSLLFFSSAYLPMHRSSSNMVDRWAGLLLHLAFGRHGLITAFYWSGAGLQKTHLYAYFQYNKLFSVWLSLKLTCYYSTLYCHSFQINLLIKNKHIWHPPGTSNREQCMRIMVAEFLGYGKPICPVVRCNIRLIEHAENLLWSFETAIMDQLGGSLKEVGPRRWESY